MLNELIMGNKNTALAKSLDAKMARQKVISNNIANVETPGYHRKEVKFEESLSEALDRSNLQGARTNGKHFALGRPKVGDVQFEIIEPIDHTMSSGVNNVDIDFEMAQLAENQINFSFSMKLLKSSYDGLNAAIQLQPKK
jgi:flagellar basal-body rod protein FlgB